MVPIKDIKGYTSGMRKSLPDKLWWLDILPEKIGSVIDYGCADGALLGYLSEKYPGLYLCGYDSSEDMLWLAAEKVQAEFFSDFAQLKKRIGCRAGKALLLASSVFHEIMAYSGDCKIDFGNIFCSGYEYIAIRDMFLSRVSLSVPVDPEYVKSIRERYPGEKLEEYEAIYGSLSKPRSFLQFLLKYRYRDNWQREIRENYFPYTLEEFIEMIPDSYEIIHLESYTLPFLRQKVNEDFNIDLKEPTHAKILLRLKSGR